MKNVLIGIGLFIGIVATASARDLSEKDLPKIFAVRDSVKFTRDYQGKNITLKGTFSEIWSPPIKQTIPFIRLIVDLRLNDRYLAYCDITPENSIQYDQLRTGDAVTMQGTINKLSPRNEEGVPVIALKAFDCSITRQ